MSNILLIDDEPMVLSSLTRLLEDDYEVFAAGGGMQALEMVRKHPIKVVISDQRMPGMLGHEVLREIKNINPNAIRMLLTGYSDLDAIMNSVNSGEIFRYINKPWRADNLVSLVKLGCQIYDQINRLQGQEAKKMTLPPATPSSSSAISSGIAITPSGGGVKPPVRAFHLEVEEKSGSVLFVDYSEDEVRKLTDKFSHSFDVSSATSVDGAFKELAKKPISVIVSNVNLGETDGISFLSAITQEYPQIVTVILTEVKDATLAVRSINELNVFKYLVKPTTDEQISKTLKDAVEKNKSQTVNPTLNTRQAAATLAPDQAPKYDEGELRLRLRAAQSLLRPRNS